MNIINKLVLVLGLVGVVAYAETVSPYSKPTSAIGAMRDLRDINGDNLQEFLKNSAPVKPLKVEPAPSPVAMLHNGPAIFLTLGVPAALADVARSNHPAAQTSNAASKKINFSDDAATVNPKHVSIAAIKNPLLQNAANMTNAMPPAVWLLGFGLLGMAGISRRKKTSE
ncbi:MAG: hypothetical protein WCC58_08040 [Burkholderiales bacterium]